MNAEHNREVCGERLSMMLQLWEGRSLFIGWFVTGGETSKID